MVLRSPHYSDSGSICINHHVESPSKHPLIIHYPFINSIFLGSPPGTSVFLGYLFVTLSFFPTVILSSCNPPSFYVCYGQILMVFTHIGGWFFKLHFRRDLIIPTKTHADGGMTWDDHGPQKNHRAWQVSIYLYSIFYLVYIYIIYIYIYIYISISYIMIPK